MCNWKKWIWPGIFAVVILTALSTWFKADVVEKDLTAKALEGLNAEHSWADVSLDGRDLTLKGTAPSPEAAKDALKIADNSYDVRIVSDASDLLSIASPFALEAEKAGGKVLLTGNVPSDDIRAEIIELAQSVAPEAAVEDQMILARGASEEFSDLANFSIGQLSGLTSGVASISDADVSIKGIASSFDTYDEAISNLAGTLPAGGNLVAAEITAPTASPYELMADYDGSTVTLSGFAPSGDARSAIEASVKEQLPEATVTNNVRIAEGAPANLVDAAKYATGFFSTFSQGRASFSDNALSISGVSKSSSEYEAAIANLPNLTSGFEIAENNIQPIGISPYNWGAKQDGNIVLLSGYAPSVDMRDRIEENAKANFPSATIDNQLEIAGGETAQYEPATGYGLKMLQNFTGGEASMIDNNLSIKGRAKTLDDYDAAIGSAGDAPDGLVVSSNVLPPIVKPYRFSAVKADSKITLSGYVQNENARATALSIAKQSNVGFEIVDELKLADGVPEGITWATATGYGLRQLGTLDQGSISIVDGDYAISGSAASNADRDAAVTSIQTGLAGGMKLASETITAPEPPAAPVADPYRWSVSKTNSGVSISGNIENQADGEGIVSIVKSSLGVAEVTDKQVIASGKPNGFDAVRRMLTNQVKRLEAGQGNVIGQTISVNGRASSEAVATEIQNTITNSLPAGYSGTTNILFDKPEPEPAVPTADPYRWSVAKQTSGITVRGNVVDDAAKSAVVEMVQKALGADVADRQVVALGKPDGFDGARELVTSQLGLLEAGQGNVVGNTLSISGRAKNEDIKNLVDKAIQERLPVGYSGSTNILFPKSEPEPIVPTANPYRWSVSKQSSGITVRGNVMDNTAKSSVMEMVQKTLGGQANDKQVIAQGKPDGFDDARTLVTSQLRLLEAGQGNVVGNNLSVSGRAKNENIKNLVDKIVQKRLPAGFTGTTNILFPKPEPAPVPIVPAVDAAACQVLITSAIDGQKILFETDRAVIKTQSEGVLKAVAKAAAECPTVRMEIGGHTDSRGRDAYNQELSEARATAVKTHLAGAGLGAARLDAKGYGETQPIASNRNSDGRAQNRRIEFNVIK